MATRNTKTQTTALRLVAFFCALSLSVGGHYGRELLGPLKTQLQRRTGSDNLHFSLLFSAYSLCATWTPLLTPWLASRLGLPWTSVLATGTVLLGQSLVAICSTFNWQGGLLIGMLTFGMGLMPVALCMELILVKFFRKRSLGLSLAFGLLGGKGASFLSSITAYPLSKIWNQLPFFVAAGLALLSFLANIVYLCTEAILVRRLRVRDNLDANVRVEEEEEKDETQRHMEARKVKLSDIAMLGDAFWAYILFSALCGALYNPLSHNLSHILQLRYSWSESDSAMAASTVLFGALVMYPISGALVDRSKKPSTAVYLLLFTSVCTLLTFSWFSLSPALTRTPTPGIIFHAMGTGAGTLALVLAVPFIVQEPWITTALAVHKSIESAVSTLGQTAFGFLLDRSLKANADIAGMMHGFLLVNLVQIACALYMLRLLGGSQQEYHERGQAGSFVFDDDEASDTASEHEVTALLPRPADRTKVLQVRCPHKMYLRGRIFSGLFYAVIVLSWVVFVWGVVNKRKK